MTIMRNVVHLQIFIIPGIRPRTCNFPSGPFKIWTLCWLVGAAVTGACILMRDCVCCSAVFGRILVGPVTTRVVPSAPECKVIHKFQNSEVKFLTTLAIKVSITSFTHAVKPNHTKNRMCSFGFLHSATSHFKAIPMQVCNKYRKEETEIYAHLTTPVY